MRHTTRVALAASAVWNLYSICTRNSRRLGHCPSKSAVSADICRLRRTAPTDPKGCRFESYPRSQVFESPCKRRVPARAEAACGGFVYSICTRTLQEASTSAAMSAAASPEGRGWRGSRCRGSSTQGLPSSRAKTWPSPCQARATRPGRPVAAPPAGEGPRLSPRRSR
jgi:hypothetical protein